MIRFFDGEAAARVEELDERRSRRPWVKTYLLEILDGHETQTSEGLQKLFGNYGVRFSPIDDHLYFVTNETLGEIGFAERLSTRIIALYSALDSNQLKSWVHRLVHSSPDIDHVWLSGLTFGVLWKLVTKLSSSSRYTRLVFTHDSIFDVDAGEAVAEVEDEQGDSTIPQVEEDDVEPIVERRATSFRLVDRVGVIQNKLEILQSNYAPLHAISQLRFPSAVGRGGHDFYDNGRVTNRSESFRDHRSHLLFVVRIYQQLLKSTEDQAWYSITESVGIPGQFRKIVGAPVLVRFQEALNQAVFDEWVNATFGRKRNKFRFWGHPIRLGPTKVHVYGVDRHLFRPLFLELTAKGCTAIIPNGTCGNTIHRLVTNIQRYLDPGAEAYIGDKPYRQIVEESAEGVPYELDGE